MTHDIVLAGFGGQGILFMGKVLAYSGLIDGKEVSWLPSYGPEMRGGTCNCSVVISDEHVSSPLVTEPTILIAMNSPSLEKFIDTVRPGGIVICDSTIVDVEVKRDDVKVFYIPATDLEGEHELKGGANIILLGKLIKESGIISQETYKKAIEKIVPPTKTQLIENNMKAIQVGMNA